MKKDVHPQDYQMVIFEDLNNGFRILTRSTVKAEEKGKWDDGTEYPLVKVHISSASHPFFTGQERLVDIEGRVDKFKARREAAEKARAEAAKRGAKAERKSSKETQKMGRLNTAK